jgi:hypothetical protein
MTIADRAFAQLAGRDKLVRRELASKRQTPSPIRPHDLAAEVPLLVETINYPQISPTGHLFKAQGKVAERLFAVPPADIAISAVSLYEIEVGSSKSARPDKQRKQFDTFLRAVTAAPIRPLGRPDNCEGARNLQRRG